MDTDRPLPSWRTQPCQAVLTPSPAAAVQVAMLVRMCMLKLAFWVMTDWRAVMDAGFVLPGGQLRADMLTELSQALRSPDPVLRDEQAYVVLARWIPELDRGQRRGLGHDMAVRFTDTEIQAR